MFHYPAQTPAQFVKEKSKTSFIIRYSERTDPRLYCPVMDRTNRCRRPIDR